MVVVDNFLNYSEFTPDSALMGIIKDAGVDPESVFYTPLIKCASNSSIDSAVQCADYLMEEIARVKPKVIVAMGLYPAMILLNNPYIKTMSEVRNKVHQMQFASVEGGKLDVRVIVSSSYQYLVNAVDSSRKYVRADFVTANAAVKLSSIRVHYRWLRDEEQLTKWCDYILQLHREGRLPYGAISCDTESNDEHTKNEGPKPYSKDTTIVSIQFAWEDGKAVAIPVIREGSRFNTPPGIAVLRQQLSRIFKEVPIVGQNFKYDATSIWKKLGLHISHFKFDTLLAHHCLTTGTGLKSDLESMACRYLGVPPYEHVILAAIEALPKGKRNYGNVSDDVLLQYGCSDSDYTLRLYGVLRDMLRNTTYTAYEVPVIYSNMLEMFEARYMFPWRAVVKLEWDGAVLDRSKFKDVADELSSLMEAATETIRNTSFHQRWMLLTRKVNPKRKVEKKVFKKVLNCSSCGNISEVTDTRCRTCGLTTTLKPSRRKVGTGEFVTDVDQPEYFETPLLLTSPQQKVRFIYENQFMALPIPKDGPSSDKESMVFLKEYCVEHGLTQHLTVLDAISAYSKAQKLYSSYAVSLPGYIYADSEETMRTSFVTAPYEPSTAVNSIHSSYFQDGTKSGRLCVDGDTRVLTDRGSVCIREIIHNIDKEYRVFSHKGVWQNVTHGYYKGRERMFTITDSAGNRITCTAGHRFYTSAGWVSCRDLRVGSEVIVHANRRGGACVRPRELSAVGADLRDCKEAAKRRARSYKQVPSCERQILEASTGRDSRTSKTIAQPQTIEGETREHLRLFSGLLIYYYRQGEIRRASKTGCECLYNVREARSLRVDNKKQHETLWSDSAERTYISAKYMREVGPNEEARLANSRYTGRMSNGVLLQQELFLHETLPSSLTDTGVESHDKGHSQNLYSEVSGRPTTTDMLVIESCRDCVSNSPGRPENPLRKSLSDKRSVLGRLSDTGHLVSGGRRVLSRNRREHEGQGSFERGLDKGNGQKTAARNRRGSFDQHGGGHEDDFSAATVVSIEDAGVRGVYDISVDTDESYVAEGFVNHNSTRDPSIHTAPKGSSIKSLFVSRFKNGFICSSDYSQAEVRVFVVETDDPDLKRAFQEGVDPHTLMASKSYKIAMEKVTKDQRSNAKSITFGILFGRGAVAIAEQTRQPLEEMERVIESFFQSAPKVKSYIDSQHAFVRKHKCVVSRFGRIRDCSADLLSKDTEYHALNVAVNHPIQGLAGDLCIDSMARVSYRFEDMGLQSCVTNTVHDSIVIDVHPDELAIVYKILYEEQFQKLPSLYPFINVPFEIDMDLGPNWRDMASWKIDNGIMTLDGTVKVVTETVARLRQSRKVVIENVQHYLTKEAKPAIVVKLVA